MHAMDVFIQSIELARQLRSMPTELLSICSSFRLSPNRLSAPSVLCACAGRDTSSGRKSLCMVRRRRLARVATADLSV